MHQQPKFEYEHIKDPEIEHLNNRLLQFRNSEAFVPYLKERNNYGYLLAQP